MAKNRRSFTAQQKLAIINEADQHGITQTLRKHNLAHSVFNRIPTVNYLLPAS